MSDKGNTKIIVVVSVLIIVALSWLTFSKPKTQDEQLMQYGDATQMSEIEKDMINMLSTVGKIEINNDLLKNRAFTVLQDRSRRITEEPIGRPNPFAPIDYAAVVNAQNDLLNEGVGADGGDAKANQAKVNLQAREEQ